MIRDIGTKNLEERLLKEIRHFNSFIKMILKTFPKNSLGGMRERIVKDLVQARISLRQGMKMLEEKRNAKNKDKAKRSS